MRFPLPVVLAALGAASFLAASSPAVRADAIDDEVKSFDDYLKTNPDAQGLKNRIAEIGLKKDPRVAKALLPLLRDRKLDEEVKIAVAQVIGEQGDRAVLGTLAAMADAKDIDEKNPKLLAGLLEGIGDCDACSCVAIESRCGRIW